MISASNEQSLIIRTERGLTITGTRITPITFEFAPKDVTISLRLSKDLLE
nr:BrnA antitoxin family protein [Cyanothece sp. BG0011]